jgi:hypothetical protein
MLFLNMVCLTVVTARRKTPEKPIHCPPISSTWEKTSGEKFNKEKEDGVRESQGASQ